MAGNGPNAAGLPRFSPLDAFKALGVVPMVFGHAVVWWCFTEDKSIDPVTLSTRIFETFRPILEVGGVWANFLPMTAGMSMAFSNLPDWPWRRVLRRFGLLYGGGALLQVCAWGTEELFTWDVFAFVALSTLVLRACLPFVGRGRLLFGVAGLTAFVSFYEHRLWGASFARTSWPVFSKGYFCQWVRAIWVGDPLGNHYFPFFPWFLSVLVGYNWIKWRSQWPWKPGIPMECLGCGAIWAVCTGVTQHVGLVFDRQNIWGAQIFMPPFIHFIQNLSLGCLGFSLLVWHRRAQNKLYVTNTLLCSMARRLPAIYALTTLVGVRMVPVIKQTPILEETNPWLKFVAFLVMLLFVTLLTATVPWPLIKSHRQSGPQTPPPNGHK